VGEEAELREGGGEGELRKGEGGRGGRTLRWGEGVDFKVKQSDK
jgi:hypothetical protein